MKSIFREYYDYTEKEIKEIWQKWVFVFDTNILTWLYRLPEEPRKNLIWVLKMLKKDNRIWTPHQVLLEYHKNRRNVIIWLEDDYNEAIHAIEWLIAELPKKVEWKLKSACEQHPLLNFDDFYKEAEKSLNNITEKIKDIKSKKHPKWKDNDEILKEIEEIFSNFWKQYTTEELKKIYQDWDNRYKNLIPPWFKDCKSNWWDKEWDNRFWDLIIWKQILAYSKDNNKSIIFITNDLKEDWWMLEYNKNIKPRIELKREFLNNSKNDFDMCDLNMFLDKTNKYLNSKINKKQIEEIKKIRELDEIRNVNFNEKTFNKYRERYYYEIIRLFEKFQMIYRELEILDIDIKYRKKLEYIYMIFKWIRNEIAHWKVSSESIQIFYSYIDDLRHILYTILEIESLPKESLFYIKDIIERLHYLNHKMKNYL